MRVPRETRVRPAVAELALRKLGSGPSLKNVGVRTDGWLCACGQDRDSVSLKSDLLAKRKLKGRSEPSGIFGSLWLTCSK